MAGNLLSFQTDVEKLLQDKPDGTDWHKEYMWFTEQLKNLQHERQIHLFVTLTVGLVCLMSCFVTIFRPMLMLVALDLLFMVLFTCYILHYRKLENTTQAWYGLQKALKELL
jgi:hypothetical protein